MRTFIAFACSLVIGCSSGGSSTGGSTSGGSSSGGVGPSGVDAKCGDADTSVVEGTLGGKPANATGQTRNWAWVNFSKPKFDGTFEGGSIHLEWAGTIANGQVTDITAATITIGSDSGPRTFQSGKLVYDSPDTESILKASITFDTGTVTVCMRNAE